MHGAGGARDVGAHVGQVPLGGALHLGELAAEGHDGAPQRQQAGVLGGEVLVEALEGKEVMKIKIVKYSEWP